MSSSDDQTGRRALDCNKGSADCGVNGQHSLRKQETLSAGLLVPKWVSLQRSNTGSTKSRGKVGQGAEDFAGCGAGEGQHKEQRFPDTDAFPFL